ncbi:hypothetical protein PRZ48_013924 [Zasmidium cellare]|uniref:HTH La-type RNA-binding domain-containing protein n=1 Tax=Zasmidium cellare TaxID=395010 RepID=A0ABR0DZG2_ZASCE|nr:hypothetical protein PRZ48_013924 [Zasmidium cellare]
MASTDKQSPMDAAEISAKQQQQVPTTNGDDAAIPTPSPSQPTAEPHPQTEEIIRQVEFYFSDENLPHDSHLLSKTGPSGQEWVSLSEILGWRKMRVFKPASRVKASLCKSQKLEVWRNKFIRRKDPITVPITATPKADPKKDRNKELVEKPWLTKNFLKPTGFEKNFVDIVTPAEHEQERTLYDPEECFTSRIDHAVARYMSKRKMHQLTLQVFTKFLMFGGFSSGPHQFTGGLTDKDMKEMDLDRDQIAQMKSQFAVSYAVVDGIDSEDGEVSWVVDFEGMAKAFLSSHFMAHFDWQDSKTVEATTNILCNFYNYLLVHDVCPEYKDQIMKARQVCEKAGPEFMTLAQANKHLPGNFNIACSTRTGGTYASIRPTDPGADWVLDGDKVGISDEDALQIFTAGIYAHGSEECLDNLQRVNKQELQLAVVSEEEMGLEVVRVEECAGTSKAIYGSSQLQGTAIKPTGKLHCVRWDLPHRPPKDLPKEVMAQLKAKMGEKYEFLVDDEVLQYCYPGFKLEGIVKELNIGIKFIDSIEYVYPSFYTWTLNEPFRDWKEPRPPKAWMLRQMAKENGVEEEAGSREGEGEIEGEEDDD